MEALDNSAALFESVKDYVKDYMSRYDASHDFQHILRVLRLAKLILADTQEGLDEAAVFLAALVHDIGDHKYAQPGEDVENQIAKLLVERGASPARAAKVQTIATNVSYSKESRNPVAFRAVLDKHPELAVVQDADRLDSLGAVGIARTFVYTGAKRGDMKEAIEHFDEKLVKLEGMMKTSAGKRLAEERTRRLREYQSWWKEECGQTY
ncbi:HD domain-containing protein [Phyllosticta citrichinensis]|uniref:HD domain-containing protein n=1 Tax=Phyllosticta citrichinensis TaxID=1130410 RepID=A0ABR1XMG6_9PEZI